MKIKLVIWDLDDTLWKGSIAEGTVEMIGDREKLPARLARKGIISSICTHNDPEPVRRMLEKLGISGFFVFPKATWLPKGQVVAEIIELARLRAENILFVDDRPVNRQHALFSCPGIHVLDPADPGFDAVMDGILQAGRDDQELSRLGQYRLLEQKEAAAGSSTPADDEEFLKSSRIRVSIRPLHAKDLERVFDLISRANQLNFTKSRASAEELAAMAAEGRGHVVHVRDRFGDHGLVGFAARRPTGEVEHFVFSCRVLNMGVEAFVFHRLGFPQFRIRGRTAWGIAEDLPDWITEEEGKGDTRRTS